MPTIRLHLEQAELDAIERFATEIGVNPEAIVYSALNRLMLVSRNPGIKDDIVDTWNWKKENLPLWSDSAGGPHAYEGMPDSMPSPSKLFRK